MKALQSQQRCPSARRFGRTNASELKIRKSIWVQSVQELFVIDGLIHRGQLCARERLADCCQEYVSIALVERLHELPSKRLQSRKAVVD